MAIPVRVDPMTSTVDVAVADPFDSHVQREVGYHLQTSVRVVHAPIHAVDAALARVIEEAGRAPASRDPVPPPPFGTPATKLALPVEKKSSDIPIPLVRRSKPPHAVDAPTTDDVDDEADDPGRITQDAIVLDPGSLPAARPSAGDLASGGPDGISAQSLDIVIPESARLPDFDSPPDTSPLLTEAVVGLERALDELDDASSRDEIVLACLRGMASVARRVGVFAVRRDVFTGWACTHSFANEVEFRSIRVERRDDTVFAHAAAEGWFVGPVPPTAPHRALLDLLRDPGREVAVAAVRLHGRPAMLILAAEMIDTMIATRAAERVVQASSRALLRVLRAEKRR